MTQIELHRTKKRAFFFSPRCCCASSSKVSRKSIRARACKEMEKEREIVRVKTTTAFIIHFNNNNTFCTTRTSITALKMVSVYIHAHTRQSILWRRRRRELGGQSAKLIQFGLHRFAIQRRRDRSNNTRERRRDRSNEYV